MRKFYFLSTNRDNSIKNYAAFLLLSILVITFALCTTKVIQAAQFTQTVADRIIATLNDTNQALGGDFVWSENTDENWFYIWRYFDPIADESLSIAKLSFNELCSQKDAYSIEFHGMEGCEIYLYQPPYYRLVWISPDLPEYVFQIQINKGDPSKYGNQASTLAEALHTAALKNGLYGDLTNEIPPVAPGEVNPEETTPNNVVPTPLEIIENPPEANQSDEPFEIPLAVIIGSLGIPVAGAFAGAVVSTLLSGVSNANTSSTPSANNGSSIPSSDTASPNSANTNQQDLFWSERPWDEAGPGYVSKEVYDRTKYMLAQGYKWTQAGWQTPAEIQQSDQWQQNNQAAAAREDAEFHAETQADFRALETRKEELLKSANELQSASNLLDLENDFNAINQNLVNKNVYVLNPFQGDPTVLFYRLNSIKNMAWDSTIGNYTGDQGLTCEGYVEKTSTDVINAVANRFPGAKVQRVVFEEKSTVKEKKNFAEYLDSFIDDNHILTKIVLPDGSEWSLDFHQHNAGNSPLFRPWQETVHAWKDEYMGNEFVERVSASTQTDPKHQQ